MNSIQKEIIEIGPLGIGMRGIEIYVSPYRTSRVKIFCPLWISNNEKKKIIKNRITLTSKLFKHERRRRIICSINPLDVWLSTQLGTKLR